MARPSRTGGKISEAKARKASRAKGSKTTKTTRRPAPAANPPKRFSVYDLKQQLERCRDELLEAREQQAATAEILKVINASPGDLTPVFNVILEKSHGLCDVPCGSLQLFDDGHTRAVAVRGMTEPFEKFLRRGYRLDRSQPVQSGRPFQIDDLTKVIVGASRGSPLRVAIELGGLRTMLSVPLVRNGVVFGRIVAGRQEVRPFSEHQIAVLQSFADQAVIAIENARLFVEVQAKTRDLSEALTYQTGSGNILSVIASSPTDVGPVLKAIVESACELCDAYDAAVILKDGDNLHVSAHHGPIPVKLEKWPINRYSVTGRSVIDQLAVHVRDVLSDEGAEFPEGQEHSRRDGFRSILSVPLLREGGCIGVIAL